MTEDELDLLASVYLDGEATSEEVALVERDPAIMARVEELRSISGQVGATPGPAPALMEQHLAAAMAVFDTEGIGAGADLGQETEAADHTDGAASPAEKPDNTVLDFRARAQAQATADAMNQVRPVKVGGLPSWMPAAAVFILISGGILALVANNSGSNDDDTAASDFETSTEESAETSEGSEETEAGGADAATESMMAEADMADSDEAAADDAMEDEEAMEEDEAMEDDAEESTDEQASAAASTTTARSGDGFFPQEPVLVFDDLPPDLYQILTDELGNGVELRDPDDSNCGPDLPLEEGNEVFGYVPIEIAGLPAELFATVAPSGEEFGLVVDAEGCIPVE